MPFRIVQSFNEKGIGRKDYFAAKPEINYLEMFESWRHCKTFTEIIQEDLCYFQIDLSEVFWMTADVGYDWLLS